MQNVMKTCIHMQREALQSILKNAPQTIPPFAQRFADKRIARVVLIGAGSSYHALNMARPLCRQAVHVPVFAATPAQLSWLDERFAGDTLVIAASQSGTSTNTLAAVKALQAKGYTVAAITQNESSAIAMQADHHTLLAMPEEKAGPKTMGVLGTMLTLQKMLIALSIAKGGTFDAKGFDRDIDTIAANLPGNIDMAIQWCAQQQERLLRSTAYFVVAQGDHAAIAGEGALKLVETVRLPVTPYEFEEIVHGPYLSFQSRPTLLYLATPCEEQTRPAALLSLCEAKGGQAFTVTLSTGQRSIEANTLTLKSAGNPLLAAYELLIPPQVLSAYLPPAMGIDLDAPHHSPQEDVMAGHL